MTENLLIQFLENPDLLDSSSLQKLKDWMKTYPFFQTAYLLHIKNLQNLHGQVENEVLHQTAAFVTDRKVLYYLLHKLPGSVEKTRSDSVGVEPVKYGKEIKDSLKENIANTITQQRHIYDLDVDSEIELIPGLAIDIRKEYGKDIELDNLDLSLNVTDKRIREEINELTPESPSETIQGNEFSPETITASLEIFSEKISYPDEPFELLVEDQGFADQKTITDTKCKIDDESVELTFEESESEPDTPTDDIKIKLLTGWSEAPEESENAPRQDIITDKSFSNKEYSELQMDIPDEYDRESNKTLIDKFIQSNPKIVPSEQSIENVDISANSIEEHESFFTDTLAKIYVKQGNYAKAILAYEKLSLKYPEKSAYFAGQISEIKKLINNT